MPFRFWTKQTEVAQLKSRVRRLENGRKNLATPRDVCNVWNSMAAGNGVMRRITAQEHWRKETDAVLVELMKDITVLERRLNGLCPLGSEIDAVSERATTGSGQSIHTVEQESASLNESSSALSPLSLPSTFTQRKADGIERMALDTKSLRLYLPGSNARAGQSDGGFRVRRRRRGSCCGVQTHHDREETCHLVADAHPKDCEKTSKASLVA